MTLTTTKTPTHSELSAVEKSLQAAYDKSVASGTARIEAELIHGKRVEAKEIENRDDLIAIYDDAYETLTITDGEFSHTVCVGNFFHTWDENDCPRPRPVHYGIKETKDFIDEFERIRGKKLNRKVQAIATARAATYVAPKKVKFTVTVIVEENQVGDYRRAFQNIGGVSIETESV